MDAHGNPQHERYQTKAVGKLGPDGRIGERKQLYQNSATGMEKASHERTMNNQGRKMVKEHVRGSNTQNTYDYYKGISETQGPSFDREWESAAKRMGFYGGGNSLPYGGRQGPVMNEGRGDPYGGGGFSQGRVSPTVA